MKKPKPAARVFYISSVFSNARPVLSQCNTQLKDVYLLSRCIVELDVYSVIHFNGLGLFICLKVIIMGICGGTSTEWL